MAQDICSVDGCERFVKIRLRGLCGMHYQRWRTTGIIGPAESLFRKGCSVEGCDRDHFGRGYCQLHHRRVWMHGDPQVVLKDYVAKGEDHYHWVGDDVTYQGMHYRVKKYRGSASQFLCIDCGQQAEEWSYNHLDENERTGTDGGHLLPYSTDVTFYEPRCKSCHRAFDQSRDRRSTR